MRIDDLEYSDTELLDMINNSPWKNITIYRGTNKLYGNKAGYIYMDINDNGMRDKPRNTNVQLHDMINDASITEVGVKIRNGLFCTTDEKQAKYYGSLVLVIPLRDSNVFISGHYDLNHSIDVRDTKMDIADREILDMIDNGEADSDDYDDLVSERFNNVTDMEAFEYIVSEYINNTKEVSPSDNTDGGELMIFGKVLLLTLDKANRIGATI